MYLDPPALVSAAAAAASGVPNSHNTQYQYLDDPFSKWYAIFTCFELDILDRVCNFIQGLQSILVRTLGCEMLAFTDTTHDVLSLGCTTHLVLCFFSCNSVNTLYNIPYVRSILYDPSHPSYLASSATKLQWDVFTNSSSGKIRSRLVTSLITKLDPLFTLSNGLVDMFSNEFGSNLACHLIWHINIAVVSSSTQFVTHLDTLAIFIVSIYNNSLDAIFVRDNLWLEYVYRPCRAIVSIVVVVVDPTRYIVTNPLLLQSRQPKSASTVVCM